MASLIQLKRSQITAIPDSLEAGEPAYTGNGDVLYIGSNGQIIPIGGKRTPGVLTANQAIVTDANSMVDAIMFGDASANATINATAISLSNSSVTFSLSKPTEVQQSGDFYLHANGSWAEVSADGPTVTPGGNNNSIQFNVDGAFTGSDTLTFNSSTNVLRVGANVVINTSSLEIGDTVVNTTTIETNDMIVNGNLVVSGEMTVVDSNTISVQDPLIKLSHGAANTGSFIDHNDIGFYGVFGNTSQTHYTGFFRDASEGGIFRAFHGQIPEPSHTVDTANVNYHIATIESYLKSSGLETDSQSVKITANSTVNVSIVANNMTLSSALGGTSGGTGLSTYDAEDLLVANSTNGFRKLSIGGNGKVLQVNNGSLVWDDLDGGSF